MAKKLTTYVWLREPGSSEQTSFGPGDNLPKWAEDALSGKDHLFEAVDENKSRNAVQIAAPKDRDDEGKVYAPTGAAIALEPAASEQGKTQLVEETSDDEADDEVAEPKGNASREAWEIFATENGVPVSKEMGRDDIRAACAAAGVTSED